MPDVTNLDHLPLILTIDEIAGIYRISTATIRRDLQNGTFRPQPFARYPYRWKRKDVAADLERPRDDHRRRAHGFAAAKAAAKARPAKMKLESPPTRATK